MSRFGRLADIVDVGSRGVFETLGYEPTCLPRVRAHKAGVPDEELPPPCGQCPQELFHAATEYDVLYGGAAGGGKMLRVDEPVPTPAGWSTIGALRPGDLIFGERGQPITVTAVHPIEQQPEAWALVFDDGSRIESCVDHLWFTYTAKDLAAMTRRDPEWRARRRATRERRGTGQKPWLAELNSKREYQAPPPLGGVRTTAEIVKTLTTAKGRTNHAMPVAGALHLPEAALPVDPYVLGAWLGDGTTAGAGFTCADMELINEIRAAGYSVRNGGLKAGPYAWIIGDRVFTDRANGRPGWVNTFSAELSRIGVRGDKHVPTAYLRGSVDQRLALLQGLMDTDGHACDSGAAEFTTTSLMLAQGTLELVLSLGWKATICEGRATLNGKDCGPKYRIKWTPDRPVFRLRRKLSRQKIASRRTTRFRYVVAAEPVGATPMRCITVDNPTGLYLVGRSMLVTHNTIALLMDGIRACHTYPGLRVGAFRRTYDELTESLIKELASVDFARAIGCHWNGSERELTFPNRAVIRFRYLETIQDATRRQGGEYQLVIIDERTLIAPDVVSMVVDERLRSGNANIPVLGVRSGTNPGGPGHAEVKARYIDATDKGKISYQDEQGRTVRFVQAKVDDNPHLDDAYRRTLDAIPDPNRRAAMKDGDWDSFAGMAFPEWRTDDVVVPPFPIPQEWVHYTGIDYGYAAPWVAEFLARDQDGRVWVFDELSGTQITERDQAKRILAAEKAHFTRPEDRSLVRAADPAMWAKTGAALSVASQYTLEGCALSKANNDRLTGKARVHTYLKPGPACAHHREQGLSVCPMLHVTNAPVLVKTIAALPVDPRRPEDVDTNAADHAYDALRYALMHIGTTASFPLGEDEPEETHRPQDTWTERVDPNLPDFTVDRDPASGGLAPSPYANV